jgi:hypothetical protein
MKLYKIIFIAVFALPIMMMAQEQKDTIAAVKEDSVPAVKEIEYERAAFEFKRNHRNDYESPFWFGKWNQ